MTQPEKEEVLWANMIILGYILGAAVLVYFLFKGTSTEKSTGAIGSDSPVRSAKSVVLSPGPVSGLDGPGVPQAAVPTGGTAGGGGQ